MLHIAIADVHSLEQCKRHNRNDYAIQKDVLNEIIEGRSFNARDLLTVKMATDTVVRINHLEDLCRSSTGALSSPSH